MSDCSSSGCDKQSMRTPLGRARGLGSAKGGTAHWWAQRLTAVALIALTLYFVGKIKYLLPAPEHYMTLRTLISSPLFGFMLAAGVIASFYHAALGVQVIIEDYVHRECCKVALVGASVLFFFAAGLACLYALVRISF